MLAVGVAADRSTAAAGIAEKKVADMECAVAAVVPWVDHMGQCLCYRTEVWAVWRSALRAAPTQHRC